MTHEEAFVCAVWPLVRRLAISFSKDIRFAIESDDLTQVGLMAALKLYRDKGSIPDGRLLNRAVRRQFVDELRRLTHRGKKTDTEQLDPSDKHEQHAVPSHEPAVIRAIDVWRNVEALPEPERTIAIGLSEGKTLKEIGEAMGVHETWIFHLKIRLRSHFRPRVRG